MPTTEEAEAALDAWRSATGQRDELVRAAHRAGVTKYRISQITGIARPTIDRILKAPSGTPHEKITGYLAGFTAKWPKTPPGGLTRLRGMASVYDSAKVADALLADQRFRALKLGTWLNTPPAELLDTAVDALSPTLLPADAKLLVDALTLAAHRQQEETRQKLAAGLLGGAALAFVIGSR
jgi:hypothetical protein